ncbi:hypothetical protein SAMN04488502_1011048 [Dendrosporobacter quercicolus]|uniref:Uncharacterized protein n=1 Tax=Dendrosporobacter quercicolus TaxID=146817 RepID=A0A1G9NL48_9FIRM|nr:hypothetical protein SAMN04488502_1011048 [Dendrosporobacter quercicolus]
MSGKQEIESAILNIAKVFGDDTAQCLPVGEGERPYNFAMKSRMPKGAADKAAIICAGLNFILTCAFNLTFCSFLNTIYLVK